MNTKAMLSVAIVCIFAAPAQTQTKPKYEFRIVAQPGTTIGDHTFDKHTVVESVALSDSGQYAFLARWTSHHENRAAIFTSDRIIAEEGRRNGPFCVKSISSESHLEINEAGQVAYQATFTLLGDKLNKVRWGIFVDDQLVASGEPGWPPQNFVLTESGSLAFERTDSRDPSALNTVPEVGAMITTEFVRRPRLPQWDGDVFLVPENSSHQQIIPVHLCPTGFVVLLATPTSH